MNYSLVGNTITLFLDGQIVHVGPGDLRYKELFPLVKKDLLTESRAREVLNFSSVLDKDIQVKEGKFLLGKKEIEIRDDLILAARENFKELKSLVYNLENHSQFDKKKTVEIFLEKKDDIVQFSKDGMRFVIFKASKMDLSETPFYYVSKPDAYFKKVLEKYKDYKALAKEIFGFSGKKFYAIFDDYFFDEKTHKVNLSLLNFFRGTKGYFDINKMQELMEVESLYREFPVADVPRLKEFLKFYFPTNEIKAYNLLVKNEKIPTDMLKNFSFLKKEEVLNPDRNFSSLQKIAREYERNCLAFKDKIETGAILETFPVLKEIDGKKIGDYRLTFPKSAREVVLWGEEMNNCFGGRASSFLSGRNLLMGLIDEENRVEFVFEVVNGRFGDFEGRIGSNTESEVRGRFDGKRMKTRKIKGRAVRPQVSRFLKKHGVLK